jgi:23S rRNA (adenine2503-C2)-methyltransferase
MRNFFDLTITELESAIGAVGNEKYRARQLYQWVYNKGVLDFSQMTNISKGLRTLFAGMFDTRLMAVEQALASGDGSAKFALAGSDGKIIESVLMPDKDRNTLCLSTQIGCRMGCRFCVTGKMGFVRNLSVSEIVGQVMAVKAYLPGERITNIVFMGMGEPLDNMDNLFKALQILKHPMGLDFSHRRVTISSVGLLDGLQRLEPKIAGIAISLNAADEATRSSLMPINRLYPIRELINFVKEFKGSNRTRITFEYVLLKGINDSLEDAASLVHLLKGVKCKINLIPYNESAYLDFRAPDPVAVEAFQQFLLDKRFTTIIRDSRARDVCGGCGQLGMRYLEEKQHGSASGL